MNKSVKRKMKRNTRGKLSIIVIAILTLSLAMPLVSVLALSEPSVVPGAPPYYVGDTLEITGLSGEVTSGADVTIYWDIASGPDAWLLNTTTGNPDGSYDVNIDIPDTTTGDHYIWVKDVATSATNGDLLIVVSPMVDTDISSGLPGDEVEITGTGFGDEQPVNVSFYNGAWYDVVVFGDDVETNEFGTFVTTFDIPDPLSYGTYDIDGFDNISMASMTFEVGASIILLPDEGPTGTIVQVEGRGWTPTEAVTFNLDGEPAEVVDGDTITVESDGEFTADVVMPYVGSVGDYILNASESGGAKGPATEIFEITGIPEISVDPTYGTPGAAIAITGANFSQVEGTEVALELWGKAPEPVVKIYDLGTAETDENGMIDDQFVSPAVVFTSYDVRAVDSIYIDRGIIVADPFKVGLIALILNPTSGTAGTELSITGIGFEDGLYNLTFGDDENEGYGTVSSEAITDTFWIPNVEPGTYQVLVEDIVGNEYTVLFTVTDMSHASMDPAVAPNEYNITLSGYNFADDAEDVTFDLYNSTDDWSMNVYEDGAGSVPAATDSDGNFTGWWEVPDDTGISLGDYTVNVTGDKGLMVQLSFSIVDARVELTPSKELFDRGNTIKFDISNDFDLPDSYIEVYNPDDTLRWTTDPFDSGEWIQPETLYTIPYYRQTANGNPMILASDDPLGTWMYFFYDVAETELMNGTFEVGPSTAAQVDALLEDVRTDLSGLSDDVSDLGGDFDALSDEIGGVSSDVDNLRDNIVGDLSDEIAAATAAANAAGAAVDDLEGSLSDLENSVGDIADTSSEALDAAADAADAANTAADAAESASTAASGLTTLVYGAIGASLIAALAAIVSLMQISRRIAG